MKALDRYVSYLEWCPMSQFGNDLPGRSVSAQGGSLEDLTPASQELITVLYSSKLLIDVFIFIFIQNCF